MSSWKSQKQSRHTLLLEWRNFQLFQHDENAQIKLLDKDSDFIAIMRTIEDGKALAERLKEFESKAIPVLARKWPDYVVIAGYLKARKKEFETV